MPYINVENWEHCKEFVDYLYRLHCQAQNNPTQFEELMDMCKQIHQRSYSSRLSNILKGEPEYSHENFTKKVVEWMSDREFLDAQGVNYPFPVRFDESFAPNLAYVFETRGNRYTKRQNSFMAALDPYLNFWQRLNQPCWQKNLLLLGLFSAMMCSSLVTFGALPAILIVGAPIISAVTLGGSYFLDRNEKSNQDSGLYRNQKDVHGVRNADFTTNFENFNYKPLTRKQKLPLANEPNKEETQVEVKFNNLPRNGRK